MIDPNKLLDIPLNEKAFIKPNIRQALLVEIMSEYKKRFPMLKLWYAMMNTNPKIAVDYVLLFKTINVKGDLPLIVYDIPVLYSNRTVPGYRYCKRMHIEDDFFKESSASLVTLSEEKFIEFVENGIIYEKIVPVAIENETFTKPHDSNIYQYCKLSNDPKSEFFWKNPKYSDIVLQGLLDLSLRFNIPKK